MVFSMVDVWEIIFDMTVFLLFVGTVCYLIKNRRIMSLKGAEEMARKTFSDFNREMLVQMTGQQMGKSLKNIADVVEKERHALATILEGGHMPAGGEKSTHHRQDASAVSPLENIEKKTGTLSKDPYDQVRRLAEEGLDGYEISKRVEKPLDEIDLILKLGRISA
jgi:hypothetical protein